MSKLAHSDDATMAKIELRAALDYLVDAIYVEVDISERTSTFKSRLEAAKAALAKAEGR